MSNGWSPVFRSLLGAPSTGALWSQTCPLTVAEGSVLDCHLSPENDVDLGLSGKEGGGGWVASRVAETPSLAVRRLV